MSFCFYCEKHVKSTVKTITEKYNVLNEPVTITTRVRFCDECGKDIADEELDAKSLMMAYDKYREKHNVLYPAEIKAIREQYNVSYETMATLTGIDTKTLKRYENGSVATIPHSNLLRLIKQPHMFAYLYHIHKNNLSEDECVMIEAKLDALSE